MKYIDGIINFLFQSLKRHVVYVLVLIILVLGSSFLINNFVPAPGEGDKWVLLWSINTLLTIMLKFIFITVSTICLIYGGLKLYKYIQNKKSKGNSE